MKYLIAYTFQAVAGQTGTGNTLVTFSGPITEQRIDDIRKSVNEANDGKFALVVITNIIPLEDGQASQPQGDPDDYRPTAEEYEDALAGAIDDIAHAREIVDGFYTIFSMSTGVAGYGPKDETVDWGQFEGLLCKADDWLAAHPDDAQEGRGY